MTLAKRYNGALSRYVATPTATTMQKATAELDGVAPSYWFDFIADTAIINGVDVGTISAGVTLTSGTLALSSAGHTITSTANILILPVTLVYPFTIMLEFSRELDTGASEVPLQLDDGTTSERAYVQITNTDALRFGHESTAGLDANIGTGKTVALSEVVRFAGRCASNDFRIYVGGVASGSDTTVATNVNPTTLRIGSSVATASWFRGVYRKLAIINGAQSNAALQAMCD